jgi:glutathione S-transferase
MKLYFSPLACSLATRISLYEASAEATYVEVDGKTKRTSEGGDFRSVNPLGLVPVLELSDGERVFENAAILQRVAECFPEAELAPRDVRGRSQLQRWLCFIGTELHKALFLPLLDEKAPEAAKAYARSKEESRLSWLARELEGRDFLLERFSVADAYLFTVLNWAQVTPVDLQNWPAIAAYMNRLRLRPSIQRAHAEERELYLRELARNSAA